jgi:hypothetical protein
MPRIIIIISFIFVCYSGFAQKVKYEDDLKRILTLPVGNSVDELKVWLGREPLNPSIFLQLGMLYEKRYKNADPLKDYPYKYGNAQLAISSYQRSIQFLNEKEVRKNEEAYFNFGTYDAKLRLSVPYDSMIVKINQSQTRLQSFVDNAPPIYDAYIQSFSNYYLAHKTYADLLSGYPTFKELYLLFDPAIDAQFEELKTSYNTFKSQFEKYKASLATYDIGYRQTLTVKPITLYRLHGLEADINFLKPEIAVWDYAKWVDETRLAIQQEIGSLRKSLATENIRLDTEVSNAKQNFQKAEETEKLEPSKEVLFNLRKYDLNTVIEPLFLYKAKKYDLIEEQLAAQQTDTSATVEIDRKLYLHGQLINSIKLADSTLSDVKRRNTPETYAKFSGFIDTYYKGSVGISQYAQQERAMNATQVKNAVNSIKNGLYQKYTQDTTERFLTYKKLQIPIQVRKPITNDSLTKNMITTQKLVTFDGAIVLGGIFKNEKESKTQAFMAAFTAEGKPAWYNEYLLKQDSSLAAPDSHTRIAAMIFIPGGMALILNGFDPVKNERINQLMVLDETGKTTLSKRLLFNQYPRSMQYIARDNSLLVTYKGDDFTTPFYKESDLIIASHNILGDLLWQQRISYTGDLVSVMEVDGAFVIGGNFNQMKMLNGKIERAGNSNKESKIFLLKVSQTGQVQNLKSIGNALPIYANIFHKVSDDCINILGTKSNYAHSRTLNSDESTSLHVIVNRDLEILSSSLN